MMWIEGRFRGEQNVVAQELEIKGTPKFEQSNNTLTLYAKWQKRIEMVL